MIYLAYVAGLLTGAAFLGGLLVGAWQQRSVKAQAALEETRKEFLKAATADEDRYEDVLDEPTVGTGHPAGPPPPSPAHSRIGKKNRIQDLVRKMGVLK